MNERILVTNGDCAFNQQLSTYLLEKGFVVTLLFQDRSVAESYQSTLEEAWRTRFQWMAGVELVQEAEEVVGQTVAGMGGLDVLINGDEGMDEMILFEQNPMELGERIADRFRIMFRLNQAVAAHMIKRKSGRILFPIVYDALSYAGYPASPILNQGKISLMKCLSRELSAFKITVNSVTFGYYRDGFPTDVIRNRRKMLQIYGLKVPVPSFREMFAVMEMLIRSPAGLIGGQNLHVGVGIETVL